MGLEQRKDLFSYALPTSACLESQLHCLSTFLLSDNTSSKVDSKVLGLDTEE